MEKYSEEFKLQVDQEYLNGPVGYKLLTKRYAISGHSNLIHGVKAYKELDLERLNKEHEKALTLFNLRWMNYTLWNRRAHHLQTQPLLLV